MKNLWIALILLLGFPIGYLLTVNWPTAFNSNILELLPDANDSAAAREARQQIRAHLSNPVLVKVSGFDAPRENMVRQLRTAIDSQPEFGAPFIVGDPSEAASVFETLQSNQETILAASWIDSQFQRFEEAQPETSFPEWLARESADNLDTFLEQPMSVAYSEHIPADPLLLLPGLFAKLPQLEATQSEAIYAWIPTTHDPMSAGSKAVIEESLDLVLEALKRADEKTVLKASGVYRLAGVSAERTQQEVSQLNIAMVVGIFGLLLLLAGRPGFLLLTFIPLLVAALWSIVGGLLAFGQIHVIALAVASVVLGLAVDYGVHLSTQRGSSSLEATWPKVRLPLITSCISTCFGFFFLLLSPSAALRQVGIMAPAGLVGALLAVRWLLPHLERWAGAYRIRPFLERPAPRLPMKVRLVIPLSTGAIACIIIVGLGSFDDDVRSFQIPIQEELEGYQQLVSEISPGATTNRWLCFASSPADLIDNLKQTRDQLGIDPLLPIAAIDPQAKSWQTFIAEQETFTDAFRTELEAHGFESTAFQPFFDKLSNASRWQSPESVEKALTELASELPPPLAPVLLNKGTTWLSVYEVPDGTTLPDSLRDFTLELSERNSLNSALMTARNAIINSMLWGVIGMMACVFSLYGLSRGTQALAVPFWSVSLGLATIVITGQHIGLLAIIGVVLAFCLALDYGAFAASSREPPASIRISSITTVCTFLILSLCSIPAIAQLGKVVASSVFFAWIGAELLCMQSPIKLSKTAHE
ncbi:MAG: hypothetical protein AAFX93_16965 [Verrucomicrobiota bacterium]